MDPSNGEREIDFETVRTLYNNLMKHTGLSAEGKEASNTLYKEVAKCIERMDTTSKQRQQSLNAIRTAEGHLDMLRARHRQHEQNHKEAVIKVQIIENALSIANHDLEKRKEHLSHVDKVVQDSLRMLQQGLSSDAGMKRKAAATNPETPGSGRSKRQKYNAYVEDDPEDN